jgi:AcrR family transcriptional regulator
MTERHPETGLPVSIETAWGRAPRARRGPKPALSLERVIDAAIEVAVSEGLGAVSMARVAEKVGTSTMSLYRYVAAKDELLALMVDRAVGRPPAASSGGKRWRAGLERWAWGFHERLREHPWALGVPISGPPTTPNQVAWLESGLRSLADTGLAEAQKASVVLLLSGYVRSEATLTADLVATNPTLESIMAGYPATLRELTDGDRFPALHAVLDAGVFDRADDPDDEFRFGLDRILDGVDALIAQPG